MDDGGHRLGSPDACLQQHDVAVDPNNPNNLIPSLRPGPDDHHGSDDEVLYLSWPDPTVNERKYTYTGGKLTRYDTTGFYPKEGAVATDWDITADESTYTFEKTYSYGHNTERMVTRFTDNLGRHLRQSFDAANARVTSKTHFDDTEEHWVYNDFNQPLRFVDRLGRVTTYAYDAKGNLEVKVVGLALDDPADPKQSTLSTTPGHSDLHWTYTANGQVPVPPC